MGSLISDDDMYTHQVVWRWNVAQVRRHQPLASQFHSLRVCSGTVISVCCVVLPDDCRFHVSVERDYTVM